MRHMVTRIKEEWMAALRSGTYLQGKGSLRNDGNFCCLGVLCDLHSKETGTEWEKNLIIGAGSRAGCERWVYLDQTGFLPGIVMTWAGLDYVSGGSFENDANLSNLNDDGVSFEGIAGVIEKRF